MSSSEHSDSNLTDAVLPLEGVRILEIGRWVALPAAGALLGEWGAEIIKIEDILGGDPTRAAFSSILPGRQMLYMWDLDNRNKKSIAIDLKQEKGREIVHKLVERSDILMCNFQPRVLRDLKIDYKTVSKINPQIVYVYLSAYGVRGPDSDKSGFDYGAFWARSGIMATIGEPDTPPPMQRPGLGDHITSICIATGALLGLQARQKTGKGLEVNLSLLSTGMWATSRDIQASLTAEEDIPRQSRTRMPNALFNSYQAKDKRWLHLTMPQSDRFWPALCRAMDITNLEHDPRFNSHAKRVDNNVALINILDNVMANRDLKEWAGIFDREGLLWAKVQTVAETTADEQVRANDFIVPFDHPSKGRIKLVASPVQFNRIQPRPRSPGPELGQHTEELLIELGYEWAAITKLKEEKVIL